MPSIGMQNVFNNLPELKVFRLDNVDDFTEAAFNVVFSKFATYKGITSLALELVVFDLENNKDALLNVMKIHSETLRRVSFAKNKVSNTFMQFLCEGLE